MRTLADIRTERHLMLNLELPPALPSVPGLTLRALAMVAVARPWCGPVSVLEQLARNLVNPLLDTDEEDWEAVIGVSLEHYTRRMGLTCSNARATVTAMTMAWRLSAKWVRE